MQMSDPSERLAHLSDEQLAADPRLGMRRLDFEFLLQQESFGTAAMIVTEFTATIQRLDAAETINAQRQVSAILLRNEFRDFPTRR